MTIADKLREYWCAFLNQHGEKPSVLPISGDELNSLHCYAEYPLQNPMLSQPSVGAVAFMGIPTYETPYADVMREKRIALPVTSLSVTGEESELAVSLSIRRLTAYLATNDTVVEVTHEWDLWAFWKRLFRITKWFPVKTRTFKVDGKVIYPKLNLPLPHEPHIVKLKVRLP